MIRRLRIMIVILSFLIVPTAFSLAQTDDLSQAIPLRVEVAVTGELTSSAPTVLYSFEAFESLRMGFYADVTDGDMSLTLVVLDEDGQTLLAESNGVHNNGVVATLPKQGQYYLAVTGQDGSSAAYRLMIDADPALPLNASILWSYAASGSSAKCEENTPAAILRPDENLNVCFTLSLIDETISLTAEWWSPSGEIVSQESADFSSGYNFVPSLTGIIYDGETSFSEGWWQVHLLINGQLAHIQWLWVSSET